MDLGQIGLGGLDWIRLAQGQGPVAGCYECGDEHSGSYATELVSSLKVVRLVERESFELDSFQKSGSTVHCLLCVYTYISNSALDGGGWSGLRPDRALSPGKDPGTHCTVGWVGPRAGLNTETRANILSPLPGIERQSHGPPADSQTLH
jgi:hypothetical protein